MDDQTNAAAPAAPAASAAPAAPEAMPDAAAPPMPAAASASAPEPEPTHEERSHRLVADFEHAMKHNAPMTMAMARELRSLLGVEGEPQVQ